MYWIISSSNSKYYCKMRKNIQQKQEINFGNGNYITRKGDLVYVNDHMKQTAKIVPSCHTKTKINDKGYVNTPTRRKKVTSSIIHCI